MIGGKKKILFGCWLTTDCTPQLLSNINYDRGVVTNWMNEGRRTATLAAIVTRNSQPGGNYGWHQPITRSSVIKKQYGKFLLERIIDTHQLIDAEKRGLCQYCKNKMLYKCKGCNTNVV